MGRSTGINYQRVVVIIVATILSCFGLHKMYLRAEVISGLKEQIRVEHEARVLAENALHAKPSALGGEF